MRTMTTTLCALTLLGAVCVRAEPPPPPPDIVGVAVGDGPLPGPPMMVMGDDPGMMLPALLQGAALTVEQRTQVQEIVGGKHAALVPLFEALRGANQALADRLIAPGPLTVADLEPQLMAVVRARQAVMKAGLEVAVAVRGVLTPEQLERAASVKQRMEQLRQEMRDLVGGEPFAVPIPGPR